jgi:hypothetical protein
MAVLGTAGVVVVGLLLVTAFLLGQSSASRPFPFDENRVVAFADALPRTLNNLTRPSAAEARWAWTERNANVKEITFRYGGVAAGGAPLTLDFKLAVYNTPDEARRRYEQVYQAAKALTPQGAESKLGMGEDSYVFTNGQVVASGGLLYSNVVLWVRTEGEGPISPAQLNEIYRALVVALNAQS